MKMGKHFSLAELTVSQQAARIGLSNRPGPDAQANLQRLVQNILDPLREQLQRPVLVTSGYRSPQVNKLVGGAKNSQHVTGNAADIIVPGLSVSVVVALLRNSALPFDQLIDEFDEWVHVSWTPRPRREVLEARRIAGKTQYRRLA